MSPEATRVPRVIFRTVRSILTGIPTNATRGVSGHRIRRVAYRGFRTYVRGVRSASILALLVLATEAFGHIVPVPPSTCTFDPVTVEAPATSAIGTTAPPVAADQFRILYDTQASNAEFDLRAVPPRAFTVGSVSVRSRCPGSCSRACGTAAT
jgi:hypothetical protein